MQLIQLVNDLLLEVGERPVVSLVTPVGRKAALSISAALEDIALLNRWSFTARRVQPVSCDAYTLKHEPLREISQVTYSGRQLLPVSLEDVEYTPNSFAILDDEHLAIKSGSLRGDLSEFTIYGRAILFFDLGDPQAIVPLPERFRQMLLTQAAYRMAVNHLGDFELAQAKSAEFSVVATRMIQRENGIGTRNRSMYRRRGR